MREFEWMMADSQADYYSSWFKELLDTETSKMTAEEYKRIADNFISNADERIEEIESLRNDLKNELVDTYGNDVEKFTRIPLEQYLKNAFPYEYLLVERY